MHQKSASKLWSGIHADVSCTQYARPLSAAQSSARIQQIETVDIELEPRLKNPNFQCRVDERSVYLLSVLYQRKQPHISLIPIS
jgi:hypothetical protein